MTWAQTMNQCVAKRRRTTCAKTIELLHALKLKQFSYTKH